MSEVYYLLIAMMVLGVVYVAAEIYFQRQIDADMNTRMEVWEVIEDDLSARSRRWRKIYRRAKDEN